MTRCDCKREELTVDQWLAIRKAEGKRIDARTAEVDCSYAPIVDPYGVMGDIEGSDCIVRTHFARNPWSEIWVCFDDLPKETRDALREKIEARAHDYVDWLPF